VKFDLRVGGIGAGALPWIPSALSTLKPTTSPRLPTIRLDFAGPPIASLHVESLIRGMGDDLRRIADEADRIKREFEVMVKFTVVRDSVFGAALDALKVSIRSPCGRSFVRMLIHLRSPLPDLAGLQLLKWGDHRPTNRVHTISNRRCVRNAKRGWGCDEFRMARWLASKILNELRGYHYTSHFARPL